MDLKYRTIVTPELEAFGTRHDGDEFEDNEDNNDRDRDGDDTDRDHDYISVLPVHHHTFDEDDYFFS